MPPILSIVGASGSGKTTLLEKLIPLLKLRGYRVGTIKHAGHAIDVDQEGKDSFRHKAAGADTVLVASPGRIAMVKDVDPPAGCDSLDRLALYLEDMDLILTEGYKREARPKIEIHRTETGKRPLFVGNPDLVAMVTNAEFDPGVVCFGIDDAAGIVDFIQRRFL